MSDMRPTAATRNLDMMSPEVRMVEFVSVSENNPDKGIFGES